jgi:uncharacterized membrane protein
LPPHNFFTLSENRMQSSPSTSKILFWLLNGLLAAALATELFCPKFSGISGPALMVLATLASMAAMQRKLPLQNVSLAAAVCALIGSLAHGFSANPDVSMPFGPIGFNAAAGEKILQFVPWTVPLLWIVVIFNARGTARLILRPWRKVKNYGYWLIGLTSVLAMVFDVALEPYAAFVRRLWFWHPTKIPAAWGGASVLNYIGWALVSLLIMMFITPPLIRKQPGNSGGADWHPLALWLGALLLFGAGAGRAGLWGPVAVDAVIAGITTFFAIRGAKW